MRESLRHHVGEWVGTWSTWMEPDVLYDVSVLELTVADKDDGWLLTYEGGLARNHATGSMYYRFDESSSRITWTDSWHTGGHTSELLGMGDDAAFYAYTDGSDPWLWTIDISPRSDRLVIIHRNIPPGGYPGRAVTARLRKR
ncbi:MAG: hypothetical protein BMS9Abin17_0244 [Acidimicrobiia bacterium]|nr:MAG: hypothetical protein BMS9Abin17_0244 [Acidimicrobiia bacterium]